MKLFTNETESRPLVSQRTDVAGEAHSPAKENQESPESTKQRIAVPADRATSLSVGRRDFLKLGMVEGTAALNGASGAARYKGPADPMGVLVDLTACVGCRLCEHACKQANGIEPGTLESYDDQSVFGKRRRPAPDSFTVVNSFPNLHDLGKPVYAKINCMHCNYAACVSACIVGALEKRDNGAVTYDAWKCIGCRYCMVACPFQLPAYSYDDVLTPEVRKCQFCFTKTSAGEMPACVKACPRQAIVYSKRNELIELAHEKIAKQPDKYVRHVYGEHEVGGTSWMYLSGVPFEQAGFLKLGTDAPPGLTEKIQHGVFKHWIAPISWYGFLASMMWLTRRRTVLEGPAPSGPELQSRPRQSEALQEEHQNAAPVTRTLLTPGVWALIAMVLVGIGFGLYRFIVGLAASTNLDQQHPWGLWIAMDVGSGIALAGGGFVTAALVHIFHREKYHAVARSALLTALLGYTFYVPGLLADIGRWYNIWHPTLPSMWQGNSVLFEVGICVMLYLNVQYAELAPIICERLIGEKNRFPRISRWAKSLHGLFEKMLPALLVLGVALSTFHQSSLGNLMVIAPYKLHPLWWTPISPVLFLLSAIMVGFPMVIFTVLFASWSLKRKPEMHVLAPLARYVPVFLSIYLATKLGDVILRGAHERLLDGSLQSTSWIVEMVAGVIVPLVMLCKGSVRNSPKQLAVACLLVILGVVLNRLNCFVIGYSPPFAEKSYFPSITEFAVSFGLIAALMLTYRVAVTYLPILEPSHEAHA